MACAFAAFLAQPHPEAAVPSRAATCGRGQCRNLPGVGECGIGLHQIVGRFQFHPSDFHDRNYRPRLLH